MRINDEVQRRRPRGWRTSPAATTCWALGRSLLAL